MLHRKLGVALRGRETFVAEHLLNGPQVRAFFEHVGTKSVAQSVRVHIRRKSLRDSNLLDDPANAAGRQPASAELISSAGVLFRCSDKTCCRAGKYAASAAFTASPNGT